MAAISKNEKDGKLKVGDIELTEGGVNHLASLYISGDDPNYEPVTLQIIEIEQTGPSYMPDFKYVLSDGKNFIKEVQYRADKSLPDDESRPFGLGKQSGYIGNNKIQVNTCIRVKAFDRLPMVASIMLHDIEFVSQANTRFGNPTELEYKPRPICKPRKEEESSSESDEESAKGENEDGEEGELILLKRYKKKLSKLKCLSKEEDRDVMCKLLNKLSKLTPPSAENIRRSKIMKLYVFTRKENYPMVLRILSETVTKNWRQQVEKPEKESSMLNKLILDKSGCAENILWFLQPNEGLRLSAGNKDLHRWIHFDNRRVLDWWNDLDLYQILGGDRPLISKICKAVEANEWLIIKHSGKMVKRNGTYVREPDTFPSLEDICECWRSSLFDDYSCGMFYKWSFGRAQDESLDDEETGDGIFDELEGSGLPEYVLEQLGKKRSKKRKVSWKCVRCSEMDTSKVIFYKISERTYCSTCMDRDLHLSMRFLKEEDFFDNWDGIEEANCMVDCDDPKIKLLDKDFSVCIPPAPWVQYDSGYDAYFVGVGNRDPSIHYSYDPPQIVARFTGLGQPDSENDEDEDEEEAPPFVLQIKKLPTSDTSSLQSSESEEETGEATGCLVS